MIEISKGPWAILPTALEAIFNARQSPVNLQLAKQSAFVTASLSRLAGMDGYTMAGDVAVLNVKGVITREADLFMQLFGGGCANAEQLQAGLQQALEDRAVKSLVLKVDSPGGEIGATVDLANAVYAARGRKPITSFIDGTGCSAAYWIASGADRIVLANATTMTGSIGVTMVHSEISKAAEKEGVTNTILSSGDFKAAGNRYEALSDADREYLQGMVSYNRNLFLQDLLRNRPGKIKPDIDARLYIGQQALDAGLADSMMGFDRLLTSLQGSPARRNTNANAQKGNTAMANMLKGTDLDLKTLLPLIRSISDFESLKSLQAEIDQRITAQRAAATDWISRQRLDSLSNHAATAVKQRRLQLKAQPAADRQRRLREIGRAIGKNPSF